MGINNFQNEYISGEKYYIKKYISPLNSPIVFDVGANVGDFTSLILKSNNSSICYLFEPHPVTFKTLDAKFNQSNVFKYNIGMGKQADTLQIFDYEGTNNEHASMIQEVITQFHKESSISHSVKITTIDDFCTANNIQKIDLLKIDTEGFEYNVLLGATEMLNQNKIKFIHFEFNAMNVYAGVFFKRFYDLLSANYLIYRLMPDGLLPIIKYEPVLHEIFSFQNILAVSKK
ncbi:MAG: FkbM family methyltransferase [Bacteroidota bacterium]|nr:FkbM family methyltransferase [Bacteroidota bacterium]